MKNTITLTTISVLLAWGCASLPPATSKAAARRALRQAKELYQEGEYQSARVLFQTYRSAQISSSERGEAFYWEGMCHLALREFGPAREKLELALEQGLDPWIRPYLYCALGESYMGSGKFDLARQAFVKALELDSENIRLDHVILRIATCAQRLNKWDEASEYLHRLLRETPDSPLVDQAREKIEYNKRRFFTVQVGAYKNEEAARKRAVELKTGNVRPFISEIRRGDETLYCVCIGKFDSWEKANLQMQKIRGAGRIEDAIVKP